MTEQIPSSRIKTVPICVDLDGTLISTDILWECAAYILSNCPWMLLLTPLWLLKGKSYLKIRLAETASIDIRFLPYNRPLLEWLIAERSSGRSLVLASASTKAVVAKISDYLEIFDMYLASDVGMNLKGAAKLRALERHFPQGFDYCGDSLADRSIWRAAKRCIGVGNGPAMWWLERNGNYVKRFPSPLRLSEAVRACRPLHWVKNLLIFLPLVTSHSAQPDLIFRSALMCLAFSLCASGVYLLNDIMDIAADRQHIRKRLRPIASGGMPISLALLLGVGLVGSSLVVARTLGEGGLAILAFYCCFTILYSMKLKRVLLADAIGLALLYVVRILAGNVVTGISISLWQLSFAQLFFVSLAFGKRVSELQSLQRQSRELVPGRGYRVQDMAVITEIGIASGLSAVVVLCLYLNSDLAFRLYVQRELLWLLVPVFLYWMARFWVLTARGAVQEDPVMFAIKDRITYAVAAAGVAILFLATHQWFPNMEIVR